MQTERPQIAIIGAGLSGLILARQLTPCAQCELFEKSRGLGGRLATRYAGDYQFDHGAPDFTATSGAFQAFVRTLEQAGVVTPWQAVRVRLQPGRPPVIGESPERHYIGIPRMNQIGKYLAKDLVIRRQTRITCIRGNPYAWWLQDEQGNQYGPYDRVVSTAPAAQTAALMPGLSGVQSVSMTGCYVLMLGFNQPLPLPWQVAEVTDAAIRRIQLNHTRPGRPTGYSMVVHATSAWTASHSAADQDRVQAQLIRSAGQLIGQDLNQAEHRAVHLWRYATCPPAAELLCCADHAAGLAACGDWCGSGTVESAYHSACAMADTLRHL